MAQNSTSKSISAKALAYLFRLFSHTEAALAPRKMSMNFQEQEAETRTCHCAKSSADSGNGAAVGAVSTHTCISVQQPIQGDFDIIKPAQTKAERKQSSCLEDRQSMCSPHFCEVIQRACSPYLPMRESKRFSNLTEDTTPVLSKHQSKLLVLIMRGYHQICPLSTPLRPALWPLSLMRTPGIRFPSPSLSLTTNT